MILEKKSILITLTVILLSGFLIAGCAKKPAQPGPGESMTQTRAPEETQDITGDVDRYTPVVEEMPSEEPIARVPDSARQISDVDISDLIDVFFSFDQAELTSEGRDALSRNARFLKTAPSVMIVIEGHCDERGTSEYNLGLGERRADTVKTYLVSLGISASRIKTISYGEEKPFALGHNEEAWQQNRRAHFRIQ